MKPGLIHFASSPPRRSERKVKTSVLKRNTETEIKAHKERLRSWELTLMGDWLSKELPVLNNSDDYFNYWEKYVRADIEKNPVYIESTCFTCKKHVNQENMFICGACPKVYHHSCLKTNKSNYHCDHHFCKGCRKGLSRRHFQCSMCPTAWCLQCKPEYADKTHTVCFDCFSYCCSNDAYCVVKPPNPVGLVF